MSQSRYKEFTGLHRGPVPLLLANIWDAASALLCQRAGAQALATSSASMAWSLGYADGSVLPREELLSAVRRIVRAARVPVTVDIEDGYSDEPSEVAELAAEIAQCGVVGINIEDGGSPAELLSRKIRAIRNTLGDRPLFINARTDVYLRGLATGEEAVTLSVKRLTEYRDAGADGGFVPGLGAVDQVHAVAASVDMPLNLMMLPGMAPVEDLFAAGARRFSAGPATFLASYASLAEVARGFIECGETEPMFAHTLTYEALNQAFAGETVPA
ncbi:isocitrate lyase/PEP mutase family protein [Microbulbifer rhizosphaerae]|uniref:2-methylisocitrate lyase-like PEP mutase family enzyme n=1 Tax=Microbulbifer rhizosphaerae TaxID=1562603 RepID=A0A7W4ZCK9_9GAMM|nr:isocitrate lyase/phosphoenolpyruvate mutase family protein [Microbulbifer rhizosphaerae]MBB3063539.1 2-methylisocitrate lyase-like PEP mutase family enzyme [Microbulbifer rhizosphaerae]